MKKVKILLTKGGCKSMNTFFYLIIYFALMINGNTLYAISVPNSAGYIIDLNGPTSAFELLRNGKKMKCSIVTILYQGDKLHLKKPNKCRKDDKYRMTIKIGDHKVIYLDKKNPKYTVPKIAKPLSIPAALFNWASKWFRVAHNEHRQALSLITKGGGDIPISIPLLEGKENIMADGKKDFYLSWHGGKSPFSLKIFFEDNKEVFLSFQGISDNRLGKTELLFTKGRYRVEITDTNGDVAIGYFVVYPKEYLTSLTKELTYILHSSDVMREFIEVIFSMRLIDKNPEWSFEAFQRVSKFSNNFYPALLLQERIEFMYR